MVERATKQRGVDSCSNHIYWPIAMYACMARIKMLINEIECSSVECSNGLAQINGARFAPCSGDKPLNGNVYGSGDAGAPYKLRIRCLYASSLLCVCVCMFCVCVSVPSRFRSLSLSLSPFLFTCVWAFYYCFSLGVSHLHPLTLVHSSIAPKKNVVAQPIIASNIWPQQTRI